MLHAVKSAVCIRCAGIQERPGAVLALCGNKNMAAKERHPIPKDGIHWVAGVSGGRETFPFALLRIGIIYGFIILAEKVNRFLRK